jgi:hypothetical protein
MFMQFGLHGPAKRYSALTFTLRVVANGFWRWTLMELLCMPVFQTGSAEPIITVGNFINSQNIPLQRMQEIAGPFFSLVDVIQTFY